ncbi:HTH-type transcriptional regulator McbR [Thalassovita gelatinovora]|uniref:HTH-type transcriptional regulator McbR n=1 Tax=Thalassovita gelatinovora TaxID=53501 RepID=A0A0P1FCM4_THAGE|nr:GntR family transcriptional regulator [Thalassovita gelatinovora]QIZ80448.1 GntR family transcriptional regulator [Thalassovita gelatinovora]CUH65855.1 HTH-type transcriptional regulator McbR [Thalassovita gelatinovora]SEQ72753.1 DNA-binding transcriptional regulator, GntR family [Thalassovita gelatinovora]
MGKGDKGLHDQAGGFSPLSRDGLVNQVAGSLVEAILSGRLSPGDRLAESTIARQMDLSRAPVREALRLLESSGLVDYKTNRGFFVHTVSAATMDNLYELRIVIESAAIARLVEANAEAALPGLKAQLSRLHRLAGKATDMITHVNADLQFHRLICEGSGNPRYLQVFEQIANETKLGLLVIGRLYDDPRKLAETHEPILAAIEARDSTAAVDAIDYHIGVAREVVTKSFATDEESSDI